MNKKIINTLGIIGLGMCMTTALTSCNEEEIKVYTRDTSSGTRDGFFTKIGFEDAVKDDSVLVEGYVRVDSNSQMISSIKNDKYGIGYISLSSLSSSGLKGLTYEGVAPTEENVVNGTYSLTRNFNYCMRETYANDTVKGIISAFVAYMSTTEGNATIKNNGGIIEKAATTSWNDIKANYSVASSDNSSVTINVGGSTSVEKIVSALLVEFQAKCGNFKYNYNPTGSSDAYKRTNGADKDSANAIDLGFASREFKSSETMADTLKGKMCIDAIVAVVNEDNDIDSITAQQLVDIYNGTTTKWDDLK